MYEVYWCILYISDAFYIVIITCKDATHRSVVLQVIRLQVCHRTVELCSADWDSSLLCDSVALILRYLCCGFCWCAGGVPRRAECRRWSLGCCGGLTHPLTCSWTVLSVTPLKWMLILPGPCVVWCRTEASHPLYVTGNSGPGQQKGYISKKKTRSAEVQLRVIQNLKIIVMCVVGCSLFCIGILLIWWCELQNVCLICRDAPQSCNCFSSLWTRFRDTSSHATVSKSLDDVTDFQGCF